MPKIRYQDFKFSAGSVDIIRKANAIIDEYRAQGFELTLRQLYYQFVSRDFIANNQREYKRLGSIVNDGRLAGLIDWTAIVDRTRNLQANSHWDSPAEILETAAKSFRYDLWEGQEYRPEVWIEKDALVGVIEEVCRENDVAFFSCRGYTSQSEMWAGAQRYLRMKKHDQTPVIIHLGDHDPSGKDMTRDIMDRMVLFMGGAQVIRIALNFDQVRKYKPPPNPAKITDSRAHGYIREFGAQSWELDALEPAVISKLIAKTINDYRDEEKWDAAVERQDAARKKLNALAKKL
ncbi:MAG: hypothetical protein MOGMAGMI_02000 [Candidatus Omnitrophica bacterium]|nr:hypothetical protein [Candidatus Omnitrophota bacterium]